MSRGIAGARFEVFRGFDPEVEGYVNDLLKVGSKILDLQIGLDPVSLTAKDPNEPGSEVVVSVLYVPNYFAARLDKDEEPAVDSDEDEAAMRAESGDDPEADDEEEFVDPDDLVGEDEPPQV
jgi:hypothetical protein